MGEREKEEAGTRAILFLSLSPFSLSLAILSLARAPPMSRGHSLTPRHHTSSSHPLKMLSLINARSKNEK
jgi:hypothetical protein